MGTHYPLHPLCSIFPEMSDEEFDALRDDIEQHGQRDPIVIWDGQILDGRHRMQACLTLGIEPKFRTVEMTWEHAKAFVLSVNLTRRHLDASQRAIIASRMATLENGQRASAVGKVSPAQICAGGISQHEAAKQLNVSPRLVQVARKVEQIAAPEAFAKVERGDMSLHEADKLARAIPDKAEQAEIVKAGRVKEVLKKALPPEEPPALPKTNTLHSPATQQRIDRGPEPSPAVHVSADPVRDLIDSTPFPLLINKIREALAECEESHRIRVAGMFQQLVNQLNPPAETKAPTLPQMRAIIDERAKLPPADDRHLRPPVATAASEWASHKISMPKSKRYQSRTSWEACLSRMATLTFDRGADVVCEMIQRAIASGYQGWEFDLNNGRNSGRPASRTAVRTGRNFEAEMGPAIDISTLENF
jgi:ParB-like chromosome segregation protein Spo0J